MTPGRAWITVAAGLGLYVLTEAALFRTSLYRTFLEPRSNAGNFEYVVEAERMRPVRGNKQILALGDSRMALRAWQANQLQSQYTFGNAGIASSTPRVWYYAVRELDPDRNRYQAIVILIDDYDDEDVAENLALRTMDAQLIIGRLGWADLPEFVASYPAWPERLQVLKRTVFKGFSYQRDLQAFLQNPKQRLADRQFFADQWKRVLASYEGESRSLAGLQIDFARRTVAGVDPSQFQTLEHVLLRYPEPQTGRTATYRRQWLGKLIQRYAGTPTRILFTRVPRGPAIRPDPLVQKQSATVRELATANRHVTLLPEDLLNELERPEFFQDALHLNAEGSRRLTRILTKSVIDAL